MCCCLVFAAVWFLLLCGFSCCVVFAAVWFLLLCGFCCCVVFAAPPEYNKGGHERNALHIEASAGVAPAAASLDICSTKCVSPTQSLGAIVTYTIAKLESGSVYGMHSCEATIGVNQSIHMCQ